MSKDKIKEILREGVDKNIMGVAITRPNQELVIMRGIPGSGKSTKSKSLVGEGIIHSTDDVIESKFDYNKFFKDMIESKDFAPLSRVHSENFKNAKASMYEGISPVIIDNTNIKANEAKNYVEAALKMGYDDKNITFVEVGTGGQTAEVLAERNTHGVPLDKIKSMMESYKSVGPLTVKKVLEAKSRYKPSKIAMVELDDASASKLFTALSHKIPKGWKVFCHHMTINFGKGLGKDRMDDLGKRVNLMATDIGISDMAIAVKVSGYPSDNDIPHVTVAVNTEAGGKPVMSNQITNWKPLSPHINLSGEVTEKKLG
jgi:predicted kinase